MSEIICPDCGASGDNVCMTKTGNPAKAMHKSRANLIASALPEMVTEHGEPVITGSGTIKNGKVTVHRTPVGNAETQKERFDVMIAQRRAASESERNRRSRLPMIKGQRIDPEAPQPLAGRADRRQQGRTKNAGHGKRFRQSVAALNDRVRQTFLPHAQWEDELLADSTVSGS